MKVLNMIIYSLIIVSAREINYSFFILFPKLSSSWRRQGTCFSHDEVAAVISEISASGFLSRTAPINMQTLTYNILLKRNYKKLRYL